MKLIFIISKNMDWSKTSDLEIVRYKFSTEIWQHRHRFFYLSRILTPSADHYTSSNNFCFQVGSSWGIVCCWFVWPFHVSLTSFIFKKFSQLNLWYTAFFCCSCWPLWVEMTNAPNRGSVLGNFSFEGDSLPEFSEFDTPSEVMAYKTER